MLASDLKSLLLFFWYRFSIFLYTLSDRVLAHIEMTILSPPCYKVDYKLVTSMGQGCNYLVACLLQPCYKLVTCMWITCI